jgi:hypothetical protein
MIDQTNQPIDYADAVASGIAATNLNTETTGNVPEALDVPDPTGDFGAQQGGTPQWSSQPSQSDFGQVDVRRGNYNTGMVPTVNVQMPFAALANRQQALGQRKAALEKQVNDFDLYSKVGSPDARYAQAYSRYATTEMNRKLKEYADAMHGGDTRSAVRDIATNPEAKRMWDGWSRNVQAVADENKKWMAINDERLANHFSGKATIRDPKALEAMMRFAASVDENRTPIGADGAPLDAGSFVNTARQAVPEIQKIQYMDEVLGDSMKNALQTITKTAIADRTEGGNIVLTKTETKQYEDAINAYVESDKRFVEDYFDGDKEEAKKFVRAFYPISTVEDKEFKGVSYAPEYMVNQQQSPQQSAVASVIKEPDAQQVAAPISRYSTYTGPFDVTTLKDVTVITPQKTVGKNVTPIYREALMDEKGNSVEVAMPSLKYDPSKGKWEWQGRSLTESAKAELTRITQSGDDADMVKDIVTNTSNLGEVKSVPASQNEAANLRMIGFRTPQEYVASILNQARGLDIKQEEVDELMKKKDTRDLINAALSGK